MWRLSSNRSLIAWLTQVLLQRLPIVCLPPFSEVLPLAFREACMVKDELGTGTLLRELELYNRTDTGIPVDHTSRLDNSLIRHKLDLASRDTATEKCEGAACFPGARKVLPLA